MAEKSGEWTRAEEELFLKLYKNQFKNSVIASVLGRKLDSIYSKRKQFCQNGVISGDLIKWDSIWSDQEQLDFIKYIESSATTAEIVDVFSINHPIPKIEEKIQAYHETNIKKDFPLYDDYRFNSERKRIEIRSRFSIKPSESVIPKEIDLSNLDVFPKAAPKIGEAPKLYNIGGADLDVEVAPENSLRKPDLGDLRDIVECMLEAGNELERNLDKIAQQISLPSAFVKIFFAELDIKAIWPKKSSKLPSALTEETLGVALNAAKKNMYMLRTLAYAS